MAANDIFAEECRSDNHSRLFVVPIRFGNSADFGYTGGTYYLPPFRTKPSKERTTCI